MRLSLLICFLIISVAVLQASEPDSSMLKLTEEQVKTIGNDYFLKHYPFSPTDLNGYQKLYPYNHKPDNQYYWHYEIIRRLDANYIVVNDLSQEIHTRGWYKINYGSTQECNLFGDPGRAILRRRLTPLFEKADKKSYDIYNSEQGFYFIDNIKISWDRSSPIDTAFLSTEETIPPANHFILKYFYANNNIKEKGLYFGSSDCHGKTGLWYYFDPEGNLIEVVDEDDRKLFPITEAYILDYCKKEYGYNEIQDNNIKKLGLPGIRIKKIANYFLLKSEWQIHWYELTPDLMKFSLRLDGKNVSAIAWESNKILLEKELLKLNEEESD